MPNSTTPLTIVLFGATGDLNTRKILPALAALYRKGELKEDVRIIAFSRRPWDDLDYRDFARHALQKEDAATGEKFLARIAHVQGTFEDKASFKGLREAVGDGEALYHLAIQPEFYAAVIREMGEAGLRGTLLIEKPFGHDRASALVLEQHIYSYFPPERVFLVDHYLGKGGLDAFLSRRRTDPAFEKSLSRERVARVTCRLLESLGIEGRGEFYDAVGALHDVGQNHVLEMLAMVLMTLPKHAEDTPEARALALETLVLAKGTVRGQYEGYAGAHEVPANSQTETYFKVEAESSMPRWRGVPIVLEAGKALREKKSEIVIHYKDGTHEVFPMDVPHARDAYEVVIMAALRGDLGRAVGSREVLAAWAFADQAAQALRTAPLLYYAPGSEGPM